MKTAATEDHAPDGGDQYPRRTVLSVILSVLVVGAYLGSEWALRDATYGEPDVSNAADWKPIVEKLPVLLRQPISRRLRANEIVRKMPSVKKENEKIKLLYELASLRGAGERRKVLLQIMDDFPSNPQAMTAWGQLLRENELEDGLTRYLAYAEACQGAKMNERGAIWSMGWGMFGNHGQRDRERYLRALVASETVSAALMEPYDELVNLAGMVDDAALKQKAEALAATCRKLWIAEQESMQ